MVRPGAIKRTGTRMAMLSLLLYPPKSGFHPDRFLAVINARS